MTQLARTGKRMFDFRYIHTAPLILLIQKLGMGKDSKNTEMTADGKGNMQNPFHCAVELSYWKP